ncbi:hypothetical protein CCH79_00000449 [Gambusia affinis]|uniref:ZP domain-containing protein n=1 Tax=Gambusia affinis TaxID=33528 RepID=A0A315VW10_GAMAF|nr:hypothetical protein CCH79_00000449 [Gambusia affinis]
MNIYSRSSKWKLQQRTGDQYSEEQRRCILRAHIQTRNKKVVAQHISLSNLMKKEGGKYFENLLKITDMGSATTNRPQMMHKVATTFPAAVTGHEENEQTHLLVAVADGCTQSSQSDGVACQFEDSENPHESKNLDYPPHVFQVFALLHALFELSSGWSNNEPDNELCGKAGNANLLKDGEDRVLDGTIIIVHLLKLRHAVDAHGNDRVSGILQSEPDVASHFSTPCPFELSQVLIKSGELLKGGIKARLLFFTLDVPVFVLDVLLSPMVPGVAAGAEVHLMDAPVLNFLTEGKNAELLHHVDATRVIEVEHTEKNARIPVELQDGGLTRATQQTCQACLREAEQHVWVHFVAYASHVEVDLVLLFSMLVEDLAIPHASQTGQEELELGQPSGSTLLPFTRNREGREDKGERERACKDDDELFTTALQLRIQGNQFSQEEVYQVAETCQYDVWASREVICDYNYMEVSIKRATQDDFPLPEHPIHGSKPSNPRHAAEVNSRDCLTLSGKRSMDTGFKATTVVFFTPEGEKPMSLLAAQQRGYGIGNTPTRLVLRSPMIAPETFMQTVVGVPMKIFKTSTIFEKKWLATQIDVVAACPIQEGSVFFTQSTITWYLPWQMDPMTSSGQFNLLEVHFGINGQRLHAVEMQAKGYSVALNDFHIVTELPIGGVGGYYKSHTQGDLYYVSYTIEPMLELLWTEGATREQTRYKVFFHITTHLLPRPLELIDNTVPGEKMFRMTLGHFAADVALMNITFPAEVLTMPDCSARGFNILEHMSPNTSLKVFTLQVPFADPAVLQQTGEGVTVYSLHLTFGLLILDELVAFSHKAYLEAVVQDIVPPFASGGCDNYNFYVLVKYGSPGYNFQTMVGKRYMTPSLAQHYDYMENGTHFSFVVPFSALDVAVEAIEPSSTRSRLDIVLSNPETNFQIQELSVACNFPSTLTTCFPNGTMTALALKLESVPLLNPSQLTLADPSCGPVHSDDRSAFFVFTVNSCGTTRKFMTNAMLYKNEISLPDELLMKKSPTSEEPEYHLKISCFYDINTSQTVAFNTRPRRSEPYAENAKGQLQVVMRLALDDSYSAFQNFEEYPLAKYQQQPLCFEVELLKSTNPLVSLELENCWATQGKDRTSQPRWDLIINGCPNPADTYQVVFHPVWTDARVRYPSHFKRFEIQKFAFADGKDDMSTKPNDILILQLFVHCDIVICDSKNPLGGICGGQCSNPKQTTKVPVTKDLSGSPVNIAAGLRHIVTNHIRRTLALKPKVWD